MTADTILDAAERITQAVGYGGLSFRDLADEVGIRSASVHYHFPTKAHLGAAVARRYTDRLVARLERASLDTGDGRRALAAYVAAFRATLVQDGRMCLVGMLAAETDALPPEVRVEVRRFVDLNVRWIAGVLARSADAPTTRGALHGRAQAIFAALEGAMLIARGMGDVARFDAIVRDFRRAGLLPR